MSFARLHVVLVLAFLSSGLLQAQEKKPNILVIFGDDIGLTNVSAAGKAFKVHLDGYNQLPYLTGQVEKSPRRGFFYFNDDGGSRTCRHLRGGSAAA